MLGSKKVRFLQSWGQYRRGAEIWPPDGIRNALLQRGLVELVIDDDDEAPETAMVEPQTEKAIKKRGRPRTREYVDGKPVRKRKKVEADVS
jgi:hypothetical protein